ncbi:MAG TPA: acyl-CoA dehydrogenase family protein [Candidatus Binatia bacterium]|jgi:(2S)-methylsuccinyl-CoA dehydrogenase|nr:acyl-CoA dehydrogenase family protein [Candidatus Binatia bacterium]
MSNEIAAILPALRATIETALESGRRITNGGKAIDDHQVHAERLAYAATEVTAAEALAEYAASRREAGQPDEHAERMAAAFAGEIAAKLRGQIEAHRDDFGVPDEFMERTLGSSEVLGAVRAAQHESRFRQVGAEVLRTRGANNAFIDGDMAEMVRDSARAFARKEVVPIAERIHRHDELVPESILSAMRELGYFGMSVPEEYGGQGMGNLPMIVITEELSSASLAAAGSLITRPEILTKALLKGGTEAQKKQWLPPVAAGELMVGISVTEPDTGSDVASVRCKAERGEQDGKPGFFINGAKAWCTFAGRANVLALLARTNPDVKLGAKGLSLFVVPKDAFDGHEFEMKQPGGGILHGKADPTPGYRGMHSFTLGFDRYFIPAANLIGEAAGEGKGFYLQMSGFAAGRLQTGGRASGLAQAALETTATYASERKQFGQPIGNFQLTQFKLGRMATHLAAARQLTYKAARLMDADESISIEPSMAKLLASDMAVWVTQEGQLIHGGWGYAEEFPIARHVVDATVLPIFEGVKPILELKVIARGLLAG